MPAITDVLSYCLTLTLAALSHGMTITRALLLGLCNIVMPLVDGLLLLPWQAWAGSFLDGLILKTYADILFVAVVFVLVWNLPALIRLLLMAIWAVIRWLLYAIWAVISGVASIFRVVLAGILYPFRLTFVFFSHLISGNASGHNVAGDSD